MHPSHLYRGLLLAAFMGALLVSHMNCAQHSGSDSSAAPSQSETDAPGLVAKTCAMADSSLRSPKTIDQAVALMRALPKPLTMNCFLQNLAPPLKVVAVDSTSSVQPSVGADNPRLFIINSALIMAVVPAGIGRQNIEFSEVYPPDSSVKAELEFPIEGDLTADAPYSRILLRPNGGTGCRACHGNEYKVYFGHGGEAYGSDILRPNPLKLLPVSDLKTLAGNCNAELQPYRCAMLKAIFIDGQATEGVFP